MALVDHLLYTGGTGASDDLTAGHVLHGVQRMVNFLLRHMQLHPQRLLRRTGHKGTVDGVDGHLLLLGHRDHPTGDLLGRREGEIVVLHHGIRQIGHSGEAIRRDLQGTGLVHLQRADDSLQQIGAVDHPLHDFVVQAHHKARLPAVALRIGLHGRQHGHQGPVGPLSGIAQRLQRHGVALLRHNGAVRAVGSSQPGDTHLIDVPQQQTLGHTAHVVGKDSHGAGRLIGKVQRSGGIHGIFQKSVKAQQLRHTLPVHRETGGGHGSTAHGTQVHTGIALQQALHITGEHLEAAGVEVAQRNGLRLLGVVGVGRDHCLLVLLRHHQQRLQ